MTQLPELVQALLVPEAYPHPVNKIELVQTQMSFVFLTDDYVYKVKKPVNLGYLDYTTLDKRHFFCQREIELNHRLCPDAYFDVVLVTNYNGRISIGGKGEIVEYAVKMRHLPQEKMLSVLLANNQVSVDMISRVAQRLVEFHQLAEIISTSGDVGTITKNTTENFDQTVKYISNTISQESYNKIKDYTENFIEHNAVLFGKRITEGRIRDCHGDLHAAHICLTNNICIYDCIEFNDRFRYCDVAAEVAFLAMDLDHYGRSDLSQSFVDAYISFSNDEELLQLLNFYKCYFAYVRGKVESFKLDDPYISEEEKVQILEVTKSYFELAESYI